MSKSWKTPPALTIDKNKTYTATLQTAKGDLVISLFAKDVPITVNSFVFLAREGYYDGCTFHRVIPGFMAQTGDPTGTGRGGPGYIFNNEITSHKHVMGAVSMANAGPNTNGSQFFITFGPAGLTESDYTIFGQVISGMEVVNGITRRDPTQNPTFSGDVITSITISEK
jgi:peptidylprolyl isomerase